VWPGRHRWRSSTLPEPYRRAQGKGSRPSPAARGVVKVDADFASEYPEGDAASTEAYASLARVGAAALLELDRAISASFDMLQPPATVLAVLDGAGRPLTPSEIGESVIAPSATMTANLDLLERRGWVRRSPNPDDRRSTLVEITDSGRATADRLLPGIRKIERAALDALTPAERARLVKALAKVLGRMAEIAEAPPVPLDGVRIRPQRLDQPGHRRRTASRG
jgi:DNA-binding MarR family transcriptional regulator